MIFKFCPQCGSKLELRDNYDEGKVPYCKEHETLYFDLPKPCAVVAVLKGDKILLLKQSYIFKDSKVLLSGYVGVDETVEETVYREVLEEAGIKIKNIEYIGSDYVVGKELLMLTYVAQYESGEISQSTEVEFIDWVNLCDALTEMKEDLIGQRVIKKILEKKGENAIYPFKKIEYVEEI
ncbi:MAG: NUDIX domain-containing protein [Sarcina sp.]